MVFVMIVCENLTKLFDANSGIKNINVQFSPGVIYGIIGYNGVGKTTLLHCIEGLVTVHRCNHEKKGYIQPCNNDGEGRLFMKMDL
jgi:ABC-type multidrug transport system ATPase subunit